MISISVVSYNSANVTLDTIRSIFHSLSESKLQYEVIVVDNASVENNVALIRSQFPQVRLIVLNENVGFAKAHNLAIEASHGDVIFLVNSDIIVINNAFDKMYNLFSMDPEIAAIGPLVLEMDGQKAATSRDRLFYSLFSTMMSIFNAIFPITTRNKVQNMPKWLKSTIFSHHESVMPSFRSREVAWVDGMFVAFSRRFLLKAGLFDSFYFFDHEIGDLLNRLRNYGGKIYYDVHSVVRHMGGYSRKKSPNIIRASLIGYVHYIFNNHRSYFFIIANEIMILATFKIVLAIFSRDRAEVGLWRAIFSDVKSYLCNPVDRETTISKMIGANSGLER
jgi:GT2 family glycosyltransferase